MIKKHIYTILFFLALGIGIFFRLYALTLVPAHPTLDEVTTGYNAYSILTTGKDEFGQAFPILLRAYDDYRPALYVYLVIPFVKIFDLSVLSVRLPAAILSVAALIASYFLTKELFKRSNKNKQIATITMLLFAISPWAIYIGRLGHEANAGFTFFILGLLFFLRFRNNSHAWKLSINIILSALFFALSFDSYQSEKIVVPIVVAALGLLYFKKLIAQKKSLVIACILGLLITIPLIYATITTPDGLIRFSGTNLFTSQESPIQKSIARLSYDQANNVLLGPVFDNRRIGNIILFSNAFFSHLNPVWLFLYQTGENFKIPDFGLINVIEIPFIVIGLFALIGGNYVGKRTKIIMVAWFIASILPGSITTDYPHAMRVMTLLPLPEIVASLGVYVLILRFPKKWLYVLLIVPYGITVVWLYHAYFTNFKVEESYRFQYGVVESLKIAQSNTQKLSRILVSNQGVLRASYMYYLFTSRYDPVQYQKNGGTVSGWFDVEHKIGKFTFANVSNNQIPGDALLVIPAGSLPENNIAIQEKIHFLDSREAIWIGVRK